MNTSAYLNDTFINLVSELNPLLNDNDDCYFLFSSLSNIHLCFIGKGIIKDSQFGDGLHKTYYIECTELIDEKSIKEQFIFQNKFTFFKVDRFTNAVNTEVKINKLPTNLYITEKSDSTFFSNNLFKIDCFFIRTSLFEITKLRQQYLKTIRNILTQQVNDISLFI